jgi:hypothetical protein
MALVRTNLTAAIAINDTSITVASANGIAAGSNLQIDAEFFEVQTSYVSGLILPVLRGQNGSASLAHGNGAAVVAGTAADFANPPAQSATSVNLPANRVREITSMGASGPIPNPLPGTDRVVFLNGGTVIAATLTNPGKDNDGDLLYIVSASPVAHTLAYAAGFGGAGGTADLATFSATATGCTVLMACNEKWMSAPSASVVLS